MRLSRGTGLPLSLLLAAAVAATPAGGAAAADALAPLTLVLCAPGYPGNTEDAQPTMDRLARNGLIYTK